ncbi:hypothetical protein DESC_610282 [Desulfosarcina cetonica]|nr:hypothetical protein DESC_610282 [Desulfosarcina cetonica]
MNRGGTPAASPAAGSAQSQAQAKRQLLVFFGEGFPSGHSFRIAGCHGQQAIEGALEPTADRQPVTGVEGFQEGGRFLKAQAGKVVDRRHALGGQSVKFLGGVFELLQGMRIWLQGVEPLQGFAEPFLVGPLILGILGIAPRRMQVHSDLELLGGAGQVVQGMGAGGRKLQASRALEQMKPCAAGRVGFAGHRLAGYPGGVTIGQVLFEWRNLEKGTTGPDSDQQGAGEASRPSPWGPMWQGLPTAPHGSSKTRLAAPFTMDGEQLFADGIENELAGLNALGPAIILDACVQGLGNFRADACIFGWVGDVAVHCLFSRFRYSF